jgi:hypothetical protein
LRECELEARNLVGLLFFPLHPKKEAPPSRARLPVRIPVASRKGPIEISQSVFGSLAVPPGQAKILTADEARRSRSMLNTDAGRR